MNRCATSPSSVGRLCLGLVPPGEMDRARIAWPYEPAIIDYHVSDGRSWRLWLSGDGVRVGSLAEADGEADVSATASAGEFVLVLYGRDPRRLPQHHW